MSTNQFTSKSKQMLLSVLFLCYFLVSSHATSITTDSWIQLATPLDPPAPREQHTSVYNFINATMVVFGGRDSAGDYNDLSSYDIVEQEWTINLQASGLFPKPRYGHTAVVSSTNKMVVFGGRNATNVFFNDIAVYDLAQNSWISVVVSGQPPQAREGHSAVVDPASNQMVIFGGVSVSGDFLQDIAFFDLGTYTWLSTPIQGTPPQASAYHSAIVGGYDTMVVFGGIKPDVLNTVSCFNLMTKTWFSCDAGGGPARYGHTAVFSPLQKMIVYAGRSSGDITDDIFELDLITFAWSQVTYEGISTGGRFFHTSLPTPFGTMIVFGGYSSATNSETADFGVYSIVNTTLYNANDGAVLVVLISLIGTLLIAICFAMDYMQEQAEVEKAEAIEKAKAEFKLLPKIPLGPKAKKFFDDFKVSLDPMKDPPQ